MIPDLENLIILQEIDLRIKEQENAKEQYPAAVADLSKRIEQAGLARGAIEAKLRQAENGVREFDEQMGKLRESLAKSEERLNSIQTNREYDAVHGEIETQKSMLSASENKKMNLEVDVLKFRTALEEAEKEFERVKSELQPQIDELNAKIGAIDSNIAEIMKERDQVAPKISLQTLRTYDSIRKKRKNGKAVSIVNAAKTCSVCFVVLRPQLHTEIRRGTDFILCESCGSMLVWNESAAQA